METNDVTYMETGVCRQHYSMNNPLIVSEAVWSVWDEQSSDICASTLCKTSFWSFYGNALLDNKSKVKNLILAEVFEMRSFQIKMHKLHKTADFHSNFLLSWELVLKSIKQDV